MFVELKIFLPPTHTHTLVVYATDRSKVVVPVLFLFCVALWFLLRVRFIILFSIVITSPGEKGAGLCASRAFVYFVRVSFCHFSLPLNVGGGGVGCGL